MTPNVSKLVERRLNDFKRRCGKDGDAALQLAYHAAMPVALNPELLHFLRINFFLDPPEQLPYTVEFEFLTSGLCREIDAELYEIEPEIRNELLQELVRREDARQRIRDIATLLWQYVEYHSPWADRVELERAQQLTALNFLDPAKAKEWLNEAEANGSLGRGEREWFIAMRQEIEELPDISTLSAEKQSEQSDLPSEKGVDYTLLRDLLAAGKWKEADSETLAVMLKASGREKDGWLDIESIENFPCTDLRTIDQLWVKYSNGRFGFSMQKRIWESVGGNPNADYETFEKFGDRVGWRRLSKVAIQKEWLDYDKLNFTKTAKEGHLPVKVISWGFLYYEQDFQKKGIDLKDFSGEWVSIDSGDGDDVLEIQAHEVKGIDLKDFSGEWVSIDSGDGEWVSIDSGDGDDVLEIQAHGRTNITDNNDEVVKGWGRKFWLLFLAFWSRIQTCKV